MVVARATLCCVLTWRCSPQFEARKYTAAVQWLKRLLLYTKFTPERLRITVNKYARAPAWMGRVCL